MIDEAVEDTERTIDKIIDCCRNEEAVVAAYIFGSASANRLKPSSDLDVALLLESGFESSFPQFQFGADLEKLSGRRVDLVILNTSGELLQYQIRSRGRLIFDRDRNKRKKFEIHGRKRYEDFLYLHHRYAKSVLYGAGNG